MTRNMGRLCAVGFIFVWLCLSISPQAIAGVSFKKVVMAGEAAPGTEPGVLFSSFESPTLNANGHTAFIANLSGPGVGGRSQWVWAENVDSVSIISRAGDTAPGSSPGDVFRSYKGIPAINKAGQVLFTGIHKQQGNRTYPQSIWLGTPVSLFSVALKDSPALGTPGIYDYFPSPPTLSEDGHIRFLSVMSGPSFTTLNNHGIWHAGPGTYNLEARSSGPVWDPRTGSALSAAFINSTTKYNAAGHIVFPGLLRGVGVDTTNDRGIVSGVSGSLTLIGQRGQTTTDLSPGEAFDDFIVSDINKLGQSLLTISLHGPSVGASNDSSLWAHDGSSLRMVVREGDVAPGTEPGVVFSGSGSHVLSNTGQAAFLGFLSGAMGSALDSTNDSGVWMERDGTLQMMVREGDQAPGAGPDAVFTEFSRPKFNGIGQILLRASLAGPDVDNANDQGIWLVDVDGSLSPVLVEGDQVDVNNDLLIDDIRTVAEIGRLSNFGYSDDNFHNFNESGQIAMHLRFTDGTQGIFLATVPEPSALILFAMALPCVSRRDR